MALSMAEDPVLASLQLLPPKIDSFRRSLSLLCKNNSDAGAAVLCKELKDYYDGLHAEMRNVYDELTRKEKSLRTSNNRETSRAAQKVVSENKGISPVNVPVPAEMEVRQKIQSLCDSMDGRGLRNYIGNNIKLISVLRDELPSALYKAADPTRLVLEALEGYDFTESGCSSVGRTESACSLNKRSCIFLLECLLPVLRRNQCNPPSDAKNLAKEVAKIWSKKMGIESNGDSFNSMDAQAFLQLLATFGIVSEYKEDRLWELVLGIAQRKRTLELCKALGLTTRLPDIVNKIFKSGKPMDALAFAQAFDIMDKVQPVPSLKAYLNDAVNAARAILEKGHGSLSSQNNSVMKEVHALKTVIKAVEKYDLDNMYPVGNLWKQLETLKKKLKDARAGMRALRKRPRSSVSDDDTPGYSDAKVPRAENHMGFHTAKHDSVARLGGAAGVVGVPPYNFDVARSTYERSHSEHYTSAYGGGNMSLVGPSIYGSVAASNSVTTPSFNADLSNYERRGPDCYASAYGGGNRNPTGAAAGNFTPVSLGGSSVYGSGTYSGHFTTPSTNAVQNNCERRGPEFHASTFSGGNGSVGGAAAGNFTAVVSSVAQGSYERQGLERYKSPFGSGSGSPIGSSVYRSGPAARVLTTSLPNVSQSNYERRGPEPYISAFDDNRTVRSSIYGSGTSTSVSFNVAQSNYQGRGSDHDQPAFGGGNSGSGAASGALMTPSSTVPSYQFNSGLPSLPSAHRASFLY